MSPNWTSSQTQWFKDDVAHYLAGDTRVDRWMDTILRNPLIGKQVDGENVLPLRDLEFEGYVIRYLIVPQSRHVEFMILYRDRDLPGRRRQFWERAWRRLVDLSAIAGVFK